MGSNLTRRSAVAGLACAAWAGSLAHAAEPAPQTVAWPALLPPGWDPRALLDAAGLEGMSDTDPAAEAAARKLRAVYDDAPPNRRLDGRRVRLWGYLMPLDADRREIRSFLLVPHFAGCIHEPAPPSNQTVLVVPASPLQAAQRGTSAVWADAVLRVARVATPQGVAGYRMERADVRPYTG